jgi:hypothetical protein
MPHCDIDQVARVLERIGQLGRSMPPAWRGAGISHFCCGPEGQVIGRILPGKGLYLDCDLKYLGIRKKVRHVVERSFMRRAFDFAMSDAAAITTISGLQKAIQAGQSQTVSLALPFGLGGGVVGSSSDLAWGDTFQAKDNGGFQAAYPNSPGGTLDQTNRGNLNGTGVGALSANMIAPSGSNTAYLFSFGINTQLSGGSTPNGYGMYVIVDELYGIGSVAMAGATVTWSPPSLTRYTSGAGVLLSCQNNADAGGVPVNATPCTFGYTNQAGASHTTSAPISFNSGVQCMTCSDPAGIGNPPFIPLASGDYGVQSVSSFQTGGNSGGAFAAIVLYYPLVFVAGTSRADDYQEYDLTSQVHGLVPLATASSKLGCISLLSLVPTGGNVPLGYSNLLFRVVQG